MKVHLVLPRCNAGKTHRYENTATDSQTMQMLISNAEIQNATEMKTRDKHVYKLEPIRSARGSLLTTFFLTALPFLFEGSFGGECVPRLLT
jgi:hypothetical protein